jgi:hypothetical protein
MELKDMILKHLIYPAGEDRPKNNIPAMPGNTEYPSTRKQYKK